MSETATPPTKKMGIGKKIGIGVGAFFVLMVIAGMTSKGEPEKGGSASAPATASAPIKTETLPAITAANLYREYKTNEVAADEKFKGHRLRVSGKVLSISKDFSDSIYLVIGTGSELGAMESVQAYFDDSQKSSILGLKPGQTVTFDGKVDGFLVQQVTVKGCMLTN